MLKQELYYQWQVQAWLLHHITLSLLQWMPALLPMLLMQLPVPDFLLTRYNMIYLPIQVR
ncbi:hypothetical protein ES708_28788 [subsurface metagenome]